MNKTKLLQYIICFVCCGLLSFVYCAVSNIFALEEAHAIYMLLTNATFSIGIICLGFGLLVFASNGGAYDMLYYGITRFFSLFKKDPTKVKYKTFYDYHVSKLDRPKSSFLFMVIVGVLYIGVSMIFLALYYKAL